jgi:hypothetical protein
MAYSWWVTLIVGGEVEDSVKDEVGVEYVGDDMRCRD